MARITSFIAIAQRERAEFSGWFVRPAFDVLPCDFVVPSVLIKPFDDSEICLLNKICLAHLERPSEREARKSSADREVTLPTGFYPGNRGLAFVNNIKRQN